MTTTVPTPTPTTTSTTAPAATTCTTPANFAELSRQVRLAGLLHRPRGRQLARVVGTDIAFVGAWLVFFLVGNSWWQLLTAACLAVAFTQVAFVGHDAGHQQLSRSRRRNDALGLVQGNLLVGLGYGWWLDKHNRHHNHPNQVGKDPDVAAGFFVFTAAEALPRHGAARWLTRRQAYLFFPMLLLEGLNLHVESVRDVARRWRPESSAGQHRDRTVTIEAMLLLGHAVVYLAVVAAVLPPGKAVAFAAVHQALFGLYMGCAFAPNHKGMPVSTHSDADFLRRQVLTSRNVRGGALTDVVLGGLNYQIEHHLFPSMPRAHLRRAQPLVQEFCRVHGISYRVDSLADSYRQALRHMHAVSAPLRPPLPLPLPLPPDSTATPVPDAVGARE